MLIIVSQHAEALDAEAELSGNTIECKSAFIAEHLASVFSVAMLFVLCNPDKVCMAFRVVFMRQYVLSGARPKQKH